MTTWWRRGKAKPGLWMVQYVGTSGKWTLAELQPHSVVAYGNEGKSSQQAELQVVQPIINCIEREVTQGKNIPKLVSNNECIRMNGLAAQEPRMKMFGRSEIRKSGKEAC